MKRVCLSILLTVLQAFVAGALPARFFGQFGSSHAPDCDDPSNSSQPPLLTPTNVQAGVNGVSLSHGPSLNTAFPQLSRPDIAPSGASNAIPTNNMLTDNAPLQFYTSEITYVDPNLSMQTVTITDLPSSQDPTVTSATQDHPDTVGVSLRYIRPRKSTDK